MQNAKSVLPQWSILRLLPTAPTCSIRQGQGRKLFSEMVDVLLESSTVRIDDPKGSVHLRYPDNAGAVLLS